MSDIFTPTPDDQIGRLAMIEAMRANTDAVNRLARHGEMQDAKLDAITAALGRIDTRLSVLEVNPLAQIVSANSAKIKDLEEKVSTLEALQNQRVGVVRFADGVVKYGPMTLALITAFFVLLIATGRLTL